MDTYTRDRLGQTAYELRGRAVMPLILVVGYDGSETAKHALHRAAELLRHRAGELEVVYVAHTPAAAGMSADALAQLRQDFDEQAKALVAEVRSQLEDLKVRWHFQRRDGAVATQLLTVAFEIDHRDGGTVDVVIVTGGSTHWFHHVAGSVGATLARRDHFPVVVVP